MANRVARGSYPWAKIKTHTLPIRVRCPWARVPMGQIAGLICDKMSEGKWSLPGVAYLSSRSRFGMGVCIHLIPSLRSTLIFAGLVPQRCLYTVFKNKIKDERDETSKGAWFSGRLR
jgi:hypothetical protein